ncbi:MAG: hypothetical protein ACP5IO_01655 [Elusimicrobiales bacterium]
MKKLILVIVSSVGIMLKAEVYDFTTDINIKTEGIKTELPTPKPQILNKNSTQTHNPYLYLPIFKKIRYEYSYTSTNFIGTKKIEVEFVEYSTKDSLTTATITYYNKNNVKKVNYQLKITDKGIFATDSIIGDQRIEIPIPLFKDRRWSENGNENRVIGFSSKVKTPYGSFDSCLKILTSIKGSEIGKNERYYAPNVGLVKEVFKSEERVDTIELVKFEIY